MPIDLLLDLDDDLLADLNIPAKLRKTTTEEIVRQALTLGRGGSRRPVDGCSEDNERNIMYLDLRTR